VTKLKEKNLHLSPVLHKWFVVGSINTNLYIHVLTPAMKLVAYVAPRFTFIKFRCDSLNFIT